MLVWIGIAVLVVVALVLLTWWARRADRIEDESSYAQEENDVAPYGKAFLDMFHERKD